MSPIILYMTWHPVRFAVIAITVSNALVWAITAGGGA